MMTIEETKTVKDIPIYRAGATDAESDQAFQSDPMSFHLRAYRQMGPVYRTWFRNRHYVVLAGVEANDFIWRNGKLWGYAHANAPFLDEMGPDHVTALDGEHHRQKRSILKPAFDQIPAMRYLPDFNHWFEHDIAAAAAKGPIELITFWGELITKINSKTVAQAEIPDELIPGLARWEFLMLRGLFLDENRKDYIAQEHYRQLKAAAFGVMGRIVDERLANPDLIDDNFGRTVKARMKLEGAAPDRDNLINDLYLILLAGTDNTSNLINWALIFTYHTPEWLAALREEVDGWDGKDVMALAGMPRLKATILETQRVRPGVFTLTKYPLEAFDFGGYHIPAATPLLHPNTMTHYLEEFYPEPFRFDPARFVENGAFAPKTNGTFGGGTHICLGRNHSMMQSPVALARVVRDYDLTFVEAQDFGVKVGYGGGRLDSELWARLEPRRR